MHQLLTSSLRSIRTGRYRAIRPHGPLITMLAVVSVSLMETVVQTHVVSAISPVIVDKQRIVRAAAITMVAVPGTIADPEIVVIVVIAEVIAAKIGAGPQVKERSADVNHNAWPMHESWTEKYRAMKATWRIQDASAFPPVIPVAGDVITAAHVRNVIIRDPHPIVVARRPEPGSPDVALLSILPRARDPEMIVRRRIARRPEFQGGGRGRQNLADHRRVVLGHRCPPTR